jgi:hypothetical protein
MKLPLKRILVWTPRILGILFALFVSIFALDVFGAGYGFWETILALLIHLVPVSILLIGLAIAWRWSGWEQSSSWALAPGISWCLAGSSPGAFMP